ncbi:IDEAL domain-containing protein [Pseudogracilibacillus auburnensis]|uniref:IDEAL domain-containing protein n=1 Tax=Pseudogracilibacillus auburnensis TaxID=1494959 RepID=A0A2V3VZE2_9BACI|nr:IDEAL domain-containing protein [Pseudogracilibacillus auburnensis]MBO1002905.1 IDEAL domain-containing protein [Pseudogracilibacillus auburnensis]PXW87000.1 IDEAL domain-containing protein [Pseudogracilibacillus auburnensis]
MKKQKLVYRFYRYDGKVLLAKNETPFEIKLSSRLILDKLCYTWNKKQILNEIDEAIDCGDKKRFEQLSEAYRSFVWE